MRRRQCESDQQGEQPTEIQLGGDMQGAPQGTEFFQTNVDFASRTIMINEIEPGVGNHFVKAMHLMMCQSDMPIHLLINSPGGLWHDALAMYDCIRAAETQVTCEVLGICMSAASVLVQACSTRFIHPNAVVMVHDGSQGMEGESKNVEIWAKWNKHERQRMYRLLAERTPHSPRYWQGKCKGGDYIMDALTAVKHGLFDFIITSEIEPQ